MRRFNGRSCQEAADVDARTAVREDPAGSPPGAARHDPARVLREVEAKRAMIARYERAAALPASVVSFTHGQDDGYAQACLDAIRDAVAIWSDHPDYRQGWRPDIEDEY